MPSQEDADEALNIRNEFDRLKAAAKPKVAGVKVEDEFVAGGGKGNVRFRCEKLATLCAKNMAIYDEIASLRARLDAADRELEREVQDLVDRGMIRIHKGYLTSRGVLTITHHPARGGVQVALLPLDDNCDHYNPASNSKPVVNEKQPPAKDADIPF